MILYHVWFSFKPGSDDSAELEKVRNFLADLKDRARLHTYRVMKNRSPVGKGRLLPYQITAEFVDGAQMGCPFAEVEQTGIHAGLHGAMIEKVDQFLVEIFEDI